MQWLYLIVDSAIFLVYCSYAAFSGHLLTGYWSDFLVPLLGAHRLKFVVLPFQFGPMMSHYQAKLIRDCADMEDLRGETVRDSERQVSIDERKI